MTTTIDITPTSEEATRIYAYVLGAHGDMSPSEFGTYWDFTEAESSVVRATYRAWKGFVDAWESAGLALTDMDIPTKRQFIQAAFKKAKGE